MHEEEGTEAAETVVAEAEEDEVVSKNTNNHHLPKQLLTSPLTYIEYLAKFELRKGSSMIPSTRLRRYPPRGCVDTVNILFFLS